MTDTTKDEKPAEPDDAADEAADDAGDDGVEADGFTGHVVTDGFTGHGTSG